MQLTSYRIAYKVCPACVTSREQAIKQLEHTLKLWYGKVVRREYAAKALELEKVVKAGNPETLREDYSLDIDTVDQLHLVYEASCSKCGYNIKLNQYLTPEKD